MPPRLDGAARALARGSLVVFPTDTLLGLGARASDPSAVARLERAKRRPSGQPLSVAVSSYEELEAIARLSPRDRAFLRRKLPGPYTLLVRPSPAARRSLAAAVARRTMAIGVRIPDHPVARELARRAGPITATSANRHGDPPCHTVGEARRTFGSEVAVYLPALPRPSGRPSMLVDLTRSSIRLVARG